VIARKYQNQFGKIVDVLMNDTDSIRGLGGMRERDKTG
jgi:hypothetical protein